MKITSPQEKWKVGDIFIEKSISGIDVCKVLRIVSDTVNYKVIKVVVGNKRPFQDSIFDFNSMTFKKNDLFRLEDDKKRTFDIIFAKAPM